MPTAATIAATLPSTVPALCTTDGVADVCPVVSASRVVGGRWTAVVRLPGARLATFDLADGRALSSHYYRLDAATCATLRGVVRAALGSKRGTVSAAVAS